MKKIGVAILGLGVVGGGTYKILTEHREFYKKNQGVDITVEGVLERRSERIAELNIDKEKVAGDIAEICSNPDIDIVVEVMGGIEPAKSFLLAALKAGKSVVTSNKELYCKYGYELENVAQDHHAGLFYEATCAGGVPIIRALLDSLNGNKISSIVGIINGTTNYILTKMSECGESYDNVLKEAQALGFAEADPTSDVEGFDAAYKLSILSSIAFHTKIPYTRISREGVSAVNTVDIVHGKKLGYTLKLLAIGKNSGNNVEARVHPAFIPSTHPLASVNYSYNAVYVTGDSVGEVMLYGKGAGEMPTGSAIVGDILFCATHPTTTYSPFKNTENSESAIKFVKNFESAYYLRLSVPDKAGVLAKITALFGKNSVSVNKIVQEEGSDGRMDIIVITHTTFENNIKRIVEEVSSLELAKVETVIKVVE